MKIRPSHVVIVGGGSGIGFATAERLIELGISTVVLSGRNSERLEDAKKQLLAEYQNTKVNIVTQKFDITDISDHMNFFEELQTKLGSIIDGLIISSGVNFSASNWRGFNISESDYDKVMQVNLKGPFFLIRNFSDYVLKNETRANICVVSSISAHRDMLSVYQISKHALSGIVHAYGKHLFQRGVILNCVEPGSTDTGMMPHLRKYSDGIREGEIWKDNALRRVLRPKEIADCICYMISENSEVLSGTCLLAGGGCRSISV